MRVRHVHWNDVTYASLIEVKEYRVQCETVKQLKNYFFKTCTVQNGFQEEGTKINMNLTICASNLFYFWHQGYIVDIKVGRMDREFDF